MCSVDGCEKPAKTRGWCSGHYARWQRHGDPLICLRGDGYGRNHVAACEVDGCETVARTRGLCASHYRKQVRSERGPCSVDGCDTVWQAKGLCVKHYLRMRSWGTTDDKAPSSLRGSCSVDGCDKPIKARGWCATHWARWRRWGSTELPPPSETKVCKECNRALPRTRFRTTSPVCEECWPAWQLAKHGPCRAPGCERVTRAKELCTTHLARFNRWGTFELPERPKPTLDTCHRCERALPPEAFPNPRERVCASCLPLLKQERRLKRLSRANSVRQSVAEMREAQGGRCAICQVREEDAGRKGLSLDHDHRTGAVRGLLCGRCNCALGLFKDDPARMLAAIAYLERTGTVEKVTPMPRKRRRQPEPLADVITLF